MTQNKKPKQINNIPETVSRRDYFAAMAMIAFMTSPHSEEGYLQNANYVAQDSWRLADALIDIDPKTESGQRYRNQNRYTSQED